MNRNNRSLLAVLATVLASAALAGDAARQPAHNLTFADINPKSATHGKTVELKSVYTGRGAVLQFVASWCKPCREDLPHLQALEASGNAPVVLVAADEGPAGVENILIVAERAALTMPILFVPPEAVAEVEKHWTHSVLPATYFLDWKGRIRVRRVGPLSTAELDGGVSIIKPIEAP